MLRFSTTQTVSRSSTKRGLAFLRSNRSRDWLSFLVERGESARPLEAESLRLVLEEYVRGSSTFPNGLRAALFRLKGEVAFSENFVSGFFRGLFRAVARGSKSLFASRRDSANRVEEFFRGAFLARASATCAFCALVCLGLFFCALRAFPGAAARFCNVIV